MTIDEDNDPNDLIGRQGGYTSAAVIFDSGAECSTLGAECGATIEVFATAADAQARYDYIDGIRDQSPILAKTTDTLAGPALLRVANAVKPSVGTQYSAAFEAAART